MADSYISLRVHFVWSTLKRAPSISPEWEARLFSYLGGVCRRRRAMLLCAGGSANHIHLYVLFFVSFLFVFLMNTLKSNSSGWVRETFADGATFAWQHGYGAFSVDPSGDDALKAYIRNQKQHHEDHYFEDEFRDLLDRHAVKYNETIWD